MATSFHLSSFRPFNISEEAPPVGCNSRSQQPDAGPLSAGPDGRIDIVKKTDLSRRLGSNRVTCCQSLSTTMRCKGSPGCPKTSALHPPACLRPALRLHVGWRQHHPSAVGTLDEPALLQVVTHCRQTTGTKWHFGAHLSSLGSRSREGHMQAGHPEVISCGSV